MGEDSDEGANFISAMAANPVISSTARNLFRPTERRTKNLKTLNIIRITHHSNTPLPPSAMATVSHHEPMAPPSRFFSALQ